MAKLPSVHPQVIGIATSGHNEQLIILIVLKVKIEILWVILQAQFSQHSLLLLDNWTDFSETR